METVNGKLLSSPVNDTGLQAACRYRMPDFLHVENLIENYTLENYKSDIARNTLYDTWNKIFSYLRSSEEKTADVSGIGSLYEYGLAECDKQQKKISGQYYTPDDTAAVMAKWFDSLEGKNICDVACGTGQLILTYLKIAGKEKARKILSEGRVYLYDSDNTALEICKSTILYLYGNEYEDKINIRCGDFLDKNVKLPEDCKVIANPPYSAVGEIPDNWDKTEIQTGTKELYSCFMEKILKQSKSSVIISPYSFLGGKKFFGLRMLLNKSGGFIVAFDNVPATIFCGKKHGIFNSNTSNSVRAAITVADSTGKSRGFRVSPLIRFKSAERNELLNNIVLESFLPDDRQLISDKNPMYCKCHKNLTKVLKSWQIMSKKSLGDYIIKNGKFTLFMPNTCRYYTTASDKELNRSGQIILNFADKDIFNYVFCMINSSFAYWHWRLYDGGITYPKNLLLSMPVFFDKLTSGDKIFFENCTKEMLSNAKDYIITKNNVGVQENIKYPKACRDMLNNRLLTILKASADSRDFDIIHSNMALRVNL